MLDRKRSMASATTRSVPDPAKHVVSSERLWPFETMGPMQFSLPFAAMMELIDCSCAGLANPVAMPSAPPEAA